MNQRLHFACLIFIFLFSSALSAEPKPAIDGYSPVSYFTKNKAEKGSAEYSVEHKGKLYYLTSAKQVTLFNENPDKYRPRHDVCSYSLAHGGVTPLDPTNYKIVAGTLLMFHKSDEGDGLQQWEQSDLTEEELLKRADHQFKLLF